MMVKRFPIHDFLKALRKKKLILGALFITFSASMSGCIQENDKSAKSKVPFPEAEIPLRETMDKSSKEIDSKKSDTLIKKTNNKKKKMKVRNDSLKQQDFINTCYFRIMNK